MELADFVIGQSFWSNGHEFRCTDVGTRVVVAIQLGPLEVTSVDGDQTTTSVTDDPSWFNGPPYAVAELVFDEYDFEVCFPTEAAMLEDAAGENSPP